MRYLKSKVPPQPKVLPLQKSAVWGNRPLGPPRYTTELKYNTPLHTHTLQMFMLRHYLGN